MFDDLYIVDLVFIGCFVSIWVYYIVMLFTPGYNLDLFSTSQEIGSKDDLLVGYLNGIVIVFVIVTTISIWSRFLDTCI